MGRSDNPVRLFGVHIDSHFVYPADTRIRQELFDRKNFHNPLGCIHVHLAYFFWNLENQMLRIIEDINHFSGLSKYFSIIIFNVMSSKI